MKRFTILLVALVLYGCATTSSTDQGRALIAEQDTEGLAVLEEAAKARYSNPETYSVWVTQRDNVVRTLVREGDMHRNVGRLDAAETAYARALQIDASATIARNGLDAVARTHRHLERVQQAEEAFQRGDLATAEHLGRRRIDEGQPAIPIHTIDSFAGGVQNNLVVAM